MELIGTLYDRPTRLRWGQGHLRPLTDPARRFSLQPQSQRNRRNPLHAQPAPSTMRLTATPALSSGTGPEARRAAHPLPGFAFCGVLS